MIGDVSREKGVELVMCFPKSINVKKYKIFLEELRNRYPFDNILIMQDNLAVHRNWQSVERMHELGFRSAFTAIYCPWLNGIEDVWAMSKSYIRKRRLNAVMKQKDVNLEYLIKKSFERLDI